MSEKKESNKGVIEDLKSIGLILGGVVIGRLVDVGAQKILKLDEGVSLSGIEEMKKFISPAVKIVGGGAGAYFVPNKTARLLLGGVAVSGAASIANYGITKVLNKTGTEISGMGEIDYGSIDRHNESLVLDNMNPNFPELSMDGAGDDDMELINTSESNYNTNHTYDDEDFVDAEIM